MSFFKKEPKKTEAVVAVPSGISVRPAEKGTRTVHGLGERPEIQGREKGTRTREALKKLPRGCLFKVGRGPAYFDLDGYFCVPKAGGQTVVSRVSSRKTLDLLTERQKVVLRNARLAAGRSGLR